MAADPTDVSGVAALAEPVRRRLYDVVVAAGEPLGREEAAARAGVQVHTARFHLDRLVEEGLLEVEYRRLTGRTGPGAGRPAKLYRRGQREISVSVPPRHYDLLSRILANAAVESSRTDEPVVIVSARLARAEGRRHGAETRSAAPEPLRRVADALATGGYEPQVTDSEVLLANCPFHRVAQEQTEFVCGLNLEYVAGIVEGVRCDGVRASLEPRPGHCCVSVGHAS